MFPSHRLPIMDEDPVLFEAPPEWLVPGLRAAIREADPDGLGLRSLLERSDAPPRLGRAARRARLGERARMSARSASADRTI